MVVNDEGDMKGILTSSVVEDGGYNWKSRGDVDVDVDEMERCGRKLSVDSAGLVGFVFLPVVPRRQSKRGT